jgi:hypothetical protein
MDNVETQPKSAALGFDTETKPSFSKGLSNKTATIQLATTDGNCLIYHIIHDHQYRNRSGNRGKRGIMSILADHTITKVGAAIKDDIKNLQKDYRLHVNGAVDVSKAVTHYNNFLEELVRSNSNEDMSKFQVHPREKEEWLKAREAFSELVTEFASANQLLRFKKIGIAGIATGIILLHFIYMI